MYNKLKDIYTRQIQMKISRSNIKFSNNVGLFGLQFNKIRTNTFSIFFKEKQHYTIKCSSKLFNPPNEDINNSVIKKTNRSRHDYQ